MIGESLAISLNPLRIDSPRSFPWYIFSSREIRLKSGFSGCEMPFIDTSFSRISSDCDIIPIFIDWIFDSLGVVGDSLAISSNP